MVKKLKSFLKERSLLQNVVLVSAIISATSLAVLYFKYGMLIGMVAGILVFLLGVLIFCLEA